MCRTCKDLWQTNYGSFAQSLTRDQLKGISLAQQAKARGEERIKVLVRLDVEAGDPVEA